MFYHWAFGRWFYVTVNTFSRGSKEEKGNQNGRKGFREKEEGRKGGRDDVLYMREVGREGRKVGWR